MRHEQGRRIPRRVAVTVGTWVLTGVLGELGGGLPAAYAQWTATGDNIRNTNSGNVGIGVETPSKNLQVHSQGVTNVYISGQAPGMAYGDASTFNAAQKFGNMAMATSAGHWVADSEAGDLVFASGPQTDSQGTLKGGNLRFGTNSQPTAAGVTRMVITNDGKVGIGTTLTPRAKLEVVGDVVVSGNLAAKYQDVAEWVPTPQALEPGTVVVVDARQANQVVPATQPYDTKVAGVVSGQPGLLLGEAGAGKVKVATTGRVKVKVDARGQAIHPGDLLVTGAQPGTAMVSDPLLAQGRRVHQPGTILGKALEPLAAGQGEILVLLTLQ